MKAFRRRLLATAASAVTAPLWMLTGAAAAPQTAPRALGYVPWWMAAAWRDMPLAHLDRLVLFEVTVQRDGGVNDNDWPGRAREIAAYAREHSVPIDVALTVHGAGVFNEIFRNARARLALAEQCKRWMDESFVAGLHLDVEGYAVADKAAIAGF